MEKICSQCGEVFRKKPSESKRYWSIKKYCSSRCYGASGFSDEHKQKLRAINIGKSRIWSDKGRTSFSEKVSGKKHPQWKGGLQTKKCSNCAQEFKVKPYRLNEAKFCSFLCSSSYRNHGLTSLNESIRKSAVYKKWRKAVFERDDYTCQICGQRGGKLNADHIKRFADYPNLRLELSNGRTLCLSCHLKTPTFGNRVRATKVMEV